MKIAFISPAGAMHRYNGSFGKHLHYAPLTMPTLAALVPEKMKAELKIYDETIEPVPLDLDADIVAMTAITGTSERVYRFADYFRGRGITVLLGGVHPSLMPEEAARHADAVFTGIADRTFPQALYDFSNGCLKSRYDQSMFELSVANRPLARRDLLKKRAYITANTMEAVRGCPHTCSFCAYPPAFGEKVLYRPVEEIIDEIKTLRGKEVLFPDVNMISNMDYAKKLFRAMIPLKKYWFGLTTSAVTLDKELMNVMQKSGCRGLLIGFESVSRKSQEFFDKKVNKPENYALLVRQLHDIGVMVNGCFAFGGDEDDRDVFKRTVDAVQQMKIDLPRYSIATPFPNTQLYRDLEAQGRIIEKNWAMYDVEHVVFRPKHMTVDELYSGIEWAWNQTYGIDAIVKRLGVRPDFLMPFIYGANFAYRRFAEKFINFSREKMCDNSDIPETVLA